MGTSLVAQWLRIHLLLQGDMSSSPALGRSYMPWSNKTCAPQLLSLCSRDREPQLLSTCATTSEACAPRARAPQKEKPPQ